MIKQLIIVYNELCKCICMYIVKKNMLCLYIKYIYI